MLADAPSPELVTSLLRTHLDPDLTCVGVSGGAVGNGQETWFLDTEDAGGDRREFVLRRTAAVGTQTDTDRALEFEVLGFLGRHGMLVPAVHWLEDQDSTLGRPYFVMDRLPGTDPGRLDSAGRAAVTRALGEWLARLHALPVEDAPPALLRGARDSAETTRAEIDRWRQNYLRGRPGPMPLVGALLAWLDVHAPSAGTPPVLVWGDPGQHNTVADPSGIRGLLDWEQAHLGHPLEDLGAASWSCLDRYDREDLIAGYEAVAGPVDRRQLRYFEVLGGVGRSVMMIEGATAYIGGLTNPVRAALGQRLVLWSLAWAAEAAGWGAAAEPADSGGDQPSSLRVRPDVDELARGIGAFLDHDILPAVGDRQLRVQLRTAIALLGTISERARHEQHFVAVRERALQELIPGGDAAALEALVVTAEHARDPRRAQLRAHLLEDLAAQRALLGPLEALYSPRP